jgi:hypothetical protein
MHHSSVQGVDPAGHPAHAHLPSESAPSSAFFASSDAASRYYQMHYESAASQGKPLKLPF